MKIRALTLARNLSIRYELTVRQPLFATLARIAPARVIMAHERELVPLQTLQADQRQVDERWPV